MSITEALDKAVAAATIDPRDSATLALAYTYSRLIDTDADNAEALGHKLLATLKALGLTADSRKGGDSNGDDELDRALKELTNG